MSAKRETNEGFASARRRLLKKPDNRLNSVKIAGRLQEEEPRDPILVRESIPNNANQFEIPARNGVAKRLAGRLRALENQKEFHNLDRTSAR
jgi:hypothetical protein